MTCQGGEYPPPLPVKCANVTWMPSLSSLGPDRTSDWGVSDHLKDNSEPMNLVKHQFALINHNLFMKQIGSNVFILNHSGIFMKMFWIFTKKNCLVMQLFKCFTVQNPFFFLTNSTLLCLKNKLQLKRKYIFHDS